MKSILRNIKRMSLCLLTLMLWFAITLPVQAAESNNLKEAIANLLSITTDALEEQLANGETLRQILGTSRLSTDYLTWENTTLTIADNTTYSLLDLASLNSNAWNQLITIENHGTLTGSPNDDCSNFKLNNYNHVNGGKWISFTNQGTLKNASFLDGWGESTNEESGTLENVTLQTRRFTNKGRVSSGDYSYMSMGNQGGIIIDGTFDGELHNDSGGLINGGTFGSAVHNENMYGTPGVITGGRFASLTNSGGTIISFSLCDIPNPTLNCNSGSLSQAAADLFYNTNSARILPEDEVRTILAECASRIGSTDDSSPTDTTNHTASFGMSSSGASSSSVLAKGASKEERPVPVHIHTYAWVVVTEPTEAENGVEEYRCTGCGEVQERIFTSAAKVYSSKVFDTIKNAEPGSTVPFETKFWTCFTKKMIDQIHEKELTLKVTFDYQHHTYTFTLKPEDNISSVEKDGYYGFLALKDLLGGHEITTETEATEKTEATEE